MSVSRYKYFEKVWNDDIQHTQAGFIDEDFKQALKDVAYINYTIELGDRYRPDIIAQKFYGEPKLFWVLVYVNDIKDSPQGFEANRVIKVPTPEIVGTLV